MTAQNKKLLHYGVAFIILIILLKKRKMLQNFINQWRGVYEVKGNNIAFSNPAFAEILRSVGWLPGQSYCMYMAKAAHIDEHPAQKEAIMKILSGSTIGSYNAAKADKTGTYGVFPVGQYGDIAIWQDTGKPWQGHAAIVLRPGATMHTIEGNTSSSTKGDQRNGGGVYEKDRPGIVGNFIPGSKLKLLGFIRKL